MKATGIVRRIDDLGRVVIPKEIRRTLKIREGEPMEIFTEAGGSVIFKKYSPAGEQSAIAGNLCEALYRTCARPVVICDRDSVIAASGALRRELAAGGLPEDSLQPVCRCPLCRDTGYVGEPIREQCVCLKRAVMHKLYQNEGLQGLESENFAAFDESIFPDTPIEGKRNSQRGYIKKIRAICEDYADRFAPGEGRGLLLSGTTGLGKTFLMHCVAQRVLERGYSVVVVSAYRLTEIMRRYQFDGEGGEQVEDMLGCDLLCIDDLGSEPMLRGVTVSAIYHILNERRSANRAIVVTTNCDSDGLYEKYDDRVGARLCDAGRMRRNGKR